MEDLFGDVQMQGGYTGQDSYGQDMSGYNQPMSTGYGQAVGGYDQAVGGYGQAIGSYGQAVGGYGQAVGGYGQAVDGYGMQDPYSQGMYANGMPKPIRYSKNQILEALRTQLAIQSGIGVTSVEKLEDYPQSIRHCCPQAKISMLSLNNFPVYEMGIQVPFYFCTACGKLFYYKDFMT